MSWTPANLQRLYQDLHCPAAYIKNPARPCIFEEEVFHNPKPFFPSAPSAIFLVSVAHSSGSTAHLLSYSLKHSRCLDEACQDRKSYNTTHKIFTQHIEKLSLCITPSHSHILDVCTPSGVLGYRLTPVWARSCHRCYRLPSQSLKSAHGHYVSRISPQGWHVCHDPGLPLMAKAKAKLRGLRT